MHPTAPGLKVVAQARPVGWSGDGGGGGGGFGKQRGQCYSEIINRLYLAIY